MGPFKLTSGGKNLGLFQILYNYGIRLRLILLFWFTIFADERYHNL